MHLGKRLVLAVCLLAGAATHAEEVKIYRDTWGVPHIYAESEAGAAFGVGYAQAEDRLEDLYKNIRTAIGRAAEVFGADHVMTDYAMRLMRNDELCKEKWPTAPQEVRTLAESYIAGVKAYVAEHPERVPEYALELEPWMCGAIGRAMILQWPIGTMFDDLGQAPKDPKFSSNCFAVAPKRSADGSAILLTDPHLTWESLAVFWEGRVHSPTLEMNGFFIVGSPLVGLGNNNKVGWAMTTGGPDTSDVYMLKFKMGFPPQYEYNGEWLTPRLVSHVIPVKGEEKPRRMPSLVTIHGPLLAEPDTEKGVAYAGKTPYMDDMEMFEQMYRMAKAQNAEEFYEALRMNHLMEQNCMYADLQGNIGYARVGRTPIRPEGVDPSKPIPGHTSATEWLGIHDINDHVRIVNPEQGYMQNCNISPQNMMLDSPLTPEKYKPYIYNVSWDKNNPRGKRMLAMLAADESVTKEDAMGITMDVYDILAEPWQKALRDAMAAPDMTALDPACQEAANLVLNWDGNFTKDSTAAPIVWKWRTEIKDKVDTAAIADGGTLSAEHQLALLTTLGEALKQLQSQYNKPYVTWGEIHVVGRNGDYYPMDGADFGGGPIFTETVKDVEAREEEKGSGKRVAFGGAMSTMLMFLRDGGIESYTCTPWGQSGDPKSPHHTDQARELFSQRKMKPTWFKKEELLEHLASEKVLQLP